MENLYQTAQTDFVSCIPEAARPWVLPALLHDPTIWEALANPEFAQRAVQSIGLEAERWCPSELCFLDLGMAAPGEDTPLEPELRLRFLQVYQELVQARSEQGSASGDSHLSRAALVAISLLENRRKSSSWMFLREDLSISLSSGQANISLWGTALSVVYGLAEDRRALLSALLQPHSSETFFRLALQALLSNPRPPADYEQILSPVCTELPFEDGVRLLSCLSMRRPEMAKHLAEHLLSQRKAISKSDNSNLQSAPARQLEEAMTQAQLLSLSGQFGEARPFLERSAELLDDMWAGVARELMQAGNAAPNADKALESWQTLIARPSASRPPIALVASLLKGGQTEAALAIVPAAVAEDPLPLRWMVEAQAAHERGDIPAARQAARRCLNATSDFLLGSSSKSHAPKSAQSSREAGLLLAHLGELCEALNLHAEAARAANLAFYQDPTDPQRCAKLAAAYRLAGEPDRAVHFAELAVALQPENFRLRWELADSLENALNYTAALEERTRILEACFAPPDEAVWPTAKEWHALAGCAIRAGKPDVAIQAAQSALHLNPEDAVAQAILGEAMLAGGDAEQALERLVQATQLAPHEASSWLSLARAYQSLGDRSKAGETLRVAAHAVPDNPEILLALAETYLDENALSQARASLARAYELLFSPTAESRFDTSFRQPSGQADEHMSRRDRALACRVGMLYGQILLDLGHPDEAGDVFENAYQTSPAYPGLAYALGSTLVKRGKLRAALAPFVIAVEAAPKDPRPYLEYGSLLLSIEEAADEAVQTIQKGMEVITELEASLDEAGQRATTEEESISSASAPVWPVQTLAAATQRWPQREPWSKDELRSFRLEALALLAQALEANGQLEEALRTYSVALESSAAWEQGRDIEMAVGMARIALRLEEPEMAIAALQEAAHKEIAMPLVQRTLAEAYAAIHLPDEALQCGRSAIQSAPDNPGLLLWFADLCSGLGAYKEAVPVLSRAMQLDARNSEAAVRLGWVLSQLHLTEEARQAFLGVLSNPEAAVQDLIQASRALYGLGDRPAAIQALDRAVGSMQDPSPDLLQELSALLQEAGEIAKALDILELAIQREPQDVALIFRKAELLYCLDRPEAAVASLEHAAQVSPADPGVRLGLASVLCDQGALEEALEQAEIAMSATRQSELLPENLAARGLSADLSRALLQIEKARALLDGKTEVQAPVFRPEKDWHNSAMGQFFGPQRQLHYYCMAAELALDADEEIAAAEWLTRAVDQDSAALRVQALQSRLAFRRGDFPLGLQILQKAGEQMRSAIDPEPDAPNRATAEDGQDRRHSANPDARRAQALDLLSIGMAALDLEQWAMAFEWLERARAISAEPYILLQQARGYILQAEFQQLCQAMEVQVNGPGQGVLDQGCYQAFKEKIQSAKQGLSTEFRAEPKRILQRLEARGQAAFTSGNEALKPLEEIMEGPEDFAAYLAQLAKRGDLVAVNQAQNKIRERFGGIPSHPGLLAQFALSKGLKGRRQEDLKDSLAAIQAAIEQRPHQPLYHAMLARIAKVLGNSSLALHAMLTALSIWPDEPRWQGMVAGLHLETGDVPTAISHLEKAIDREPEYLQHYLQLGKAHLEVGECTEAIAALEKAVAVSPDQVEGYIALASAYFLSGDLGNAAAASEKAARLDAQNLPALLLRAEVALRAESYEQVRDGARQILQIQPDHPQGLHLLVQALHGMGLLEEALKVVDQAIPLSENPLPLMLDRICVLEQLNGTKATLEALREVARDYPDDPAVLARLAESLAEAGETAEAIRSAQRALRNADHGMYPADKAALHRMLGRMLRQTGQLDQAIHQMSEAARLAPDQLSILLDLGAIQFERRQYSHALETYQLAIQVAPLDPRPYYEAGMALKMGRDYAEAEVMLRRASELAPQDLNIHRQLAALIALNLVHSHRSINVAG